MEDFLKHDLEPLSYLVYCVAICIRLRTQVTKMGKLLLGYYGLAAIMIAIACHSVEEVNRALYNIFFFITIFFFSYYYHDLMLSKMKRYVIGALFILNLAMFVKLSVVSHQMVEINNYTYAITYGTIVVYVLLFYDQVLRNVSELNILHQFDFWLASGYLMYFLGSFFIILFYDNVEVKYRSILWSVKNIILLFSSLLTLAGTLWINYRLKYY